jgi:HK97 family phage major capsid protein
MDAELKGVLDSIRESTTSYGTKIDDIQTQLDAVHRINHRMQETVFSDQNFRPSGQGELELKKALEESQEFNHIRSVGKGSATISIKDLSGLLDTKTTITSSTLGYGTPGVLNPAQVGGIVPLAERRLFLRDLLFRGNKLDTGAAFFIREATFTNNASPQQSESHTKGESGNTFTTTSRNVATIAHWLPISRQAIDDMPALLDFIRRKLLFGLRYKEELQLLAGSGAGFELEGLITAATAFSTGLLGSSYTKADLLRRALQQVEAADEVPAGFFVLNPRDWADIELSKNSQGDYLVGDPRAATTPVLWGKPVVVTTAMTQGTFLAGSTEAAEVLDRQDATIEISLDHEDYRARNLAMILCECRTVQLIYRPAAIIYGSLASSPA